VSVLPPIEEEFVSTGQVRVQSRVIATQGQESVLAAQASECANDQGRFWEFHDTLYANQRGRDQGAFSSENLKRFAEALELDTVAFDSCLDSGKYASKVREDTEAARQQGVNAVPRVFVNGRMVVDSQNRPSWHLEDVEAAIQEALGSGQ
jgi:protein-disulfide isomerase